MSGETPWHDCADEPTGLLISGFLESGDSWTCPICGEVWIFCEDEAEGGFWLPRDVAEGE